MNIDLEALGITKEELQHRVVERMCEKLLRGVSYDEDGDEYETATVLERQFQKEIQERVDAAVEQYGANHILPFVTERIEGLILQRTNDWGQKKGEPVTFQEYLLQRAEHYMKEEVNFDGKSKTQDSYNNWRSAGPRLTYLVDKHLQYEISTAMKKALEIVNGVLPGAIAGTVKAQMAEILEKLKVTASVGR